MLILSKVLEAIQILSHQCNLAGRGFGRQTKFLNKLLSVTDLDNCKALFDDFVIVKTRKSLFKFLFISFLLDQLCFTELFPYLFLKLQHHRS